MIMITDNKYVVPCATILEELVRKRVVLNKKKKDILKDNR